MLKASSASRSIRVPRTTAVNDANAPAGVEIASAMPIWPSVSPAARPMEPALVTTPINAQYTRIIPKHAISSTPFFDGPVLRTTAARLRIGQSCCATRSIKATTATTSTNAETIAGPKRSTSRGATLKTTIVPTICPNCKMPKVRIGDAVLLASMPPTAIHRPAPNPSTTLSVANIPNESGTSEHNAVAATIMMPRIKACRGLRRPRRGAINSAAVADKSNCSDAIPPTATVD